MIGHQPLQIMRRKGFKPDSVFVRDSDSPIARKEASEWHIHPNCFSGRYYAQICLDDGDLPEAMDWRCLIGLPVQLDGNRGIERLRRLFKVIRDNHPLQIVCIAGDKVGIFDGSVSRG